MATKEKKSAAASDATKVTRIKATDTKETPKKKLAATKPASQPVKAKRRLPHQAAGDYFKGAWYELKQVRWPTRKATWEMTLALLGFTAFFVVLILLLDALFKYIFELILG